MRANSILFLILAAFFWLADAAYIVWSINSPVLVANGQTPGVEWVGTVAIGLSGVLAAFLAFFFGRTHAAQGGGELPEDMLEAEIDDGDAEQGFFSPWSWWPVMLAGSATIIILGLAIGFWIAFIGFALLAVSMVGWQYEYYRGRFAH